MTTLQMPVTEVNNINVASLNRLMNRMIFEVNSSASAGIEYIKQPDLDRIYAYLLRYEKEVDHAEKMKDYDMPETKNWVETLETPEAYEETENEYINLILSFLNRWRGETMTSQSSKQQLGLIPPDVKRERSYLALLRDMLKSVVEPTQPGDFPASSPQEQPTTDPRN